MKKRTAFGLVAAAVAIVAAPSRAGGPVYAPHPRYQCDALVGFLRLRNATGVDAAFAPFLAPGQPWPRPGEPCCGFDAAAAGAGRAVSCDGAGRVRSLRWTSGELAGAPRLWQLPAAAELPGEGASAALLPLPVFDEIDLAGNPRLAGPIAPRQLPAGLWLRRLNLSHTGVSGQLPRLDVLTPALEELDLSGTALSGWLPPMPKSLRICRIPQTVCSHAGAEWAAGTPPACVQGLPPCAGDPFPYSEPPPAYPPVRPHWGDVPKPWTDHGLGTIEEQCGHLADWLQAQQPDPGSFDRAKFLAGPFGSGKTCCGVHRQPGVRVECTDGAITYLSAAPYGSDVNEPRGSISELKALIRLELWGGARGGFPDFLWGMPDLAELTLRLPNATGPIPGSRLASLENLVVLDVSGSGYAPALEAPLLHPARDLGVCSFRDLGRPVRYCRLHDSEFYPPGCVFVSGEVLLIDRCEPPVLASEVAVETGWTCLESRKYHQWMLLRRLRVRGRRTAQCRGPDGESCFFYRDGNCTAPYDWDAMCCTPRSEADPLGDGWTCEQVELDYPYPAGCQGPLNCADFWCSGTARPWLDRSAPVPTSTAAISPTAPPPTSTAPPTAPTPSPTTWTCMRSCSDKGNYVSVRRSPGTGRPACLGPDAGGCSWYSDPLCRNLAPGEPVPSTSGAGFECPEGWGGWCAAAEAVLGGGLSADRTCATGSSADIPTSTPSPPASTAAAVSRASGWIALTVAALALLV